LACLQVWRAAEAAIVTDTSQQGTATITACSCGVQSLTGYSQPDLAGCNVLCLAGPETSNSSMRHLLSAQLKRQHAIQKMLLYRRDGSPFWAMAASCPLAAWRQTSAPKLSAAAAGLLQQQLGSSSNSGSASSRQGSNSSNGASSLTLQLLLLIDITSSHAKRVGKYTLGRVLGAGASGVVQIGRNTDSGRKSCCRSLLTSKKLASGCVLPQYALQQLSTAGMLAAVDVSNYCCVVNR
jgi:hypothetical protein